MEIFENRELKDLNWFKTGGLAKFYCEPITASDFLQALNFADQNHLEFFVLGSGANLLISDAGFDGLVIHPANAPCHISEGSIVRASAGVEIQDLIDFCLQNNLIGLEEFSGIPGTVGGSVYINIHYFEFLLSQFLVRARLLDCHSRQIIEVDNTWFEFGYDSSKLHQKQHILIEADFQLNQVDQLTCAYAKGRSAEIARHRQRRYPNQGTCGSFFQNFAQADLIDAKHSNPVVYIAYYLDKLGFKGNLKVGDAIVSHKHANMLVNQGYATSADIISLAQIMQKAVEQEFGLKPKPECQLIGFNEKLL